MNPKSKGSTPGPGSRASELELSGQHLEELRQGAAALGISLRAQQLGAFSAYAKVLVQWASRVNLTRLTSPAEIVQRHFLDSLTCIYADEFPRGAKVIDVGSGPGFPGLPIKIVRPDLSMTLLDASAKRVAFLEIVLDRLQITAETVHGRAEEVAHASARREAYDRVVSRAIAPLPQLLDLCLPFVRRGGRCVFPKGPRLAEELGMASETLIGHNAAVVSVVGIPETVSLFARREKTRRRYVLVLEKRLT